MVRRVWYALKQGALSCALGKEQEKKRPGFPVAFLCSSDRVQVTLD
jgi:hypothetical protein